LAKQEYAQAVDKAIFPGLQGGPLEHIIAAKAAAFREASAPEFASYAQSVVENARSLGLALAERGLRLVSGGTDNHLLLVDLRDFDSELTGKQAQETLEAIGIVCNRNQIPGDERSAFVTSGLRLGTAAETTCGMGKDEMTQVADIIVRALKERGRADELEKLGKLVSDLARMFQPYSGELAKFGAFGIDSL
jgi:glycine hydroxymethyltransferase